MDKDIIGPGAKSSAPKLPSRRAVASGNECLRDGRREDLRKMKQSETR